MSADTIFAVAIIVFVLMVIGLFLTMREFNGLTDDPSRKKGGRVSRLSGVSEKAPDLSS